MRRFMANIKTCDLCPDYHTVYKPVINELAMSKALKSTVAFNSR